MKVVAVSDAKGGIIDEKLLRSAERVHLSIVPVKAASKFGHQPPNFVAPEGMP